MKRFHINVYKVTLCLKGVGIIFAHENQGMNQACKLRSRERLQISPILSGLSHTLRFFSTILLLYQ